MQLCLCKIRCGASALFLRHSLDLPIFLKSMILVSTSQTLSTVLAHRHIPHIRADCGFVFCVYKLIFSKSKGHETVRGARPSANYKSQKLWKLFFVCGKLINLMRWSMSEPDCLKKCATLQNLNILWAASNWAIEPERRILFLIAFAKLSEIWQ